MNLRAQQVRAWLDYPLSTWSCVLGWCVATALFMGLVAGLGFAGYDEFESVFSTWAIAHGQFACAFPSGFKVTAPLYPLVSGGIAAASHIGHAVPFPARDTMGPHCDRAFVVINAWSIRSGALVPTLKISYLSWFVLLAGAIGLLRAAGRGRCRWEPAALIVLACLPPVWTCLQTTFHPEDVLAMGLVLGALACTLRGSWIGAGLLIGLAFLSQQFALLAAVPLLILAPPARRVAYAAAAAAPVAVVALLLAVRSGTSATRSIFLGTGDTGGVGGTVLWELGLHGTPLLLLSRITPLLLAAAIAWWAVRRLGAASVEPVALLSIVALSLSLRLVFEQQLFLYYFMALSVSLVLLDVVRGHIRGSLVAWLVLMPTIYVEDMAIPESLETLIPAVTIAIAAVVIASLTLRSDPRRQLVPWIAVVIAVLLAWDETNVLGTPPTWLWQLVLVIPGVLLAARPLIDLVRAAARSHLPSGRAVPVGE